MAKTSNWTPLWQMHSAETTPLGSKKLGSLLHKTKLQSPDVVSSWWQNHFVSIFANQFASMTLFSFCFQMICGFLPHLFGAEKHYFSMGPLNIALCALYTWFSNPNWGLRHILVNVCVLLWSARLGRFLSDRARVFGSGRKMKSVRNRPAAKLSFWLGQWMWVMVCLLPVIALNATPVSNALFDRAYWRALPSLAKTFTDFRWSNFSTWGRYFSRTLFSTTPNRFSLSLLNWRDIIGIFGLWLPGFIMETVADNQKTRFRASKNKHAPFLHHGLWSIVRHPNYLGELMMWAGITLSASNAFSGWSRLAYLCPVIIFFILTKISGIPLVEYSLHKQIRAIVSKQNEANQMRGNDVSGQFSNFNTLYQRYLNTTRALIPFVY